jgi:hypothetical protein
MYKKATYHSQNHRNDSVDFPEDIDENSEQREVSELVPDDNESFINDLDEELQEVVGWLQMFHGWSFVGFGSLRREEDVDMNVQHD